MKIKLLKKLRKEAQRHFKIIVCQDGFLIVRRLMFGLHADIKPHGYYKWARNLTWLTNVSLPYYQNDFIIHKIEKMKRERELKMIRK